MGFKNLFSNDKIVSDFNSFKQSFCYDMKNNNYEQVLAKLKWLMRYCLFDSNAQVFFNDKRDMIRKTLNDSLQNDALDELNSLLDNYSSTDRHNMNIIRTVEKILRSIDGRKKVHAANTFIIDYDKIVSSSSVRRLQDKTQVYPLEQYDFARTRLTHTHEVASIAEQLGDIIGRKLEGHKHNGYLRYKLKIILRCSSMIHDIGNPPFGHFGEDVIRSYYSREYFDNHVVKVYDIKKKEIIDYQLKNMRSQLQNDFINYDGNAQGLRIITKLQKHKSEDLNLSACIISGMIKYPFNSDFCSDKSKFGYFYSEEDVLVQLEQLGTYQKYIKNPISLLLEAADDVANFISDLEDATKKGIITYERFVDIFEDINDDNELIRLKYAFEKAYSENKGNKNRFEKTMHQLILGLKKSLINNIAQIFIDLVEKHDGIEKIVIDVTKKENKNYSLLKQSSLYTLYKLIKEQIFEKYLYVDKDILKSEIEGFTIINYLIRIFTESILNIGLIIKENRTIETKNYLNLDASTYKKYVKIYNLISDNFVEVYIADNLSHEVSFEHQVYFKLRLVIDYISGMTDTYAKKIYQFLNGI